MYGTVYLITLPSREVIEELASHSVGPPLPFMQPDSTLANIIDSGQRQRRCSWRHSRTLRNLLRNLRDFAMVLNDHDQNLQNDRSILKSLYL